MSRDFLGRLRALYGRVTGSGGHRPGTGPIEPAESCAFERSPGGSRVYRYEERSDLDELAHGDEGTIEAISEHIERYVGPIETVFHELVSPTVHVDVHYVRPTEQHPFHTLVTSGMSDRPMTVPEGLEKLAYAEVVVLLPPDWPISQDDFRDERNYWPIRLLKVLARFPHEYGTWLGLDHTMPNGDPPAPYADDTSFCGVLLTVPLSLPKAFFTLEAPERNIQFLVAIPLHADEMELKLAEGVGALYDRFDDAGVSDVIDVTRASTGGR